MNSLSKYIILILFGVLATTSVLAQTYEFNNCGSTGHTGPSSCSYGGDNSVSITQDGYQQWTVPEEGVYSIEVAGAQGGVYNGEHGQGAIISGDFVLNNGENIMIVVGQRGEGNEVYSGDTIYDTGGGGGTFVWNQGASSPLIVAGGGAGHIYEFSQAGKFDANTGECGKDSTTAGAGSIAYSGGCNGQGGEGDGQYHGGGGGGWLSAGEEYSDEGGNSIRDGNAVGGSGERNGQPGGYGGFGGGGGGWRNGASEEQGPGGGGGYSGGAGAEDSSSGGGGSYIDPSAESTSSTVGNNGHGSVGIELLESCEASFSDPVIQTPSYTDSQASSTNPASFDTDVDVNVDSSYTDGCGNTYSNSLDSCSVTATGEDGNSYSPSTSISGSTCEFSLDNIDDGTWQPGEEITLDISVSDSNGGSDSITDTHTFENTPPEVTGTTPTSGETVFNEQGILVEADVVDWESYHTGDDLTVNLKNFDTTNTFYSTSTGGDSTVSSRWSGGDNTNEFEAMYGFDRGSEATYEVYVEDVTGASTTTDDFFTVEDAPEISGASPSGGAEGSTLSASIENPVETDHNDVIFRTVSNGVVGEDRIFTQAGTASTSVGDELVPGNTYEWYVEVDDTASSTVYDGITYMFTVPEVLRGEVRDSFRIPTSAPEDPQQGNIWVEVNRLTWQGADQTWWLQFTGTVAENAAAAPGSLWIEENAVNWVGTTGEHRRYEGTEIGGTDTAGLIWIDDYNGDDLLHYTDQDGNITVVDGN